MPISELSTLAALRTKLQRHQQRQRVLAENVANANTPNFRPRDLKPPETSGIGSTPLGGSIGLAQTSSGHLALSGLGGGLDADRRTKYEVRTSGNAVNLEDEMVKVASNQMDFQAVTSLYIRSLGLLKTAIGKR